jgi:hypothetical protein
MRFDPPRLEQPLTAPFYLSRELPFHESPNIRDLGGTGDYQAPKRLKFRMEPGPHADIVLQMTAYLSLGQHMTPALFHAWLLERQLEPVALAQRSFRLENALPIVLETPIWTFVPSVDTPFSRGMWIQSALPLGIANQIAGKSTDNVFVEICPLDVIKPGLPEANDLLRAIWVVRVGTDYVVTIFRRGVVGTYSVTVQYGFNAETGIFVPRKSALGDYDGAANDPLKALFLTLTVLRDLSPGIKPPPTYNLAFDAVPLPLPLLEPQLALPHEVPGTPYIIPRALDGTPYLRASGGPRETKMFPGEPELAINAFERFLPQIKAPNYVALAAADWAEMLAAQGDLVGSLNILKRAADAAEQSGVPMLIARVEELTYRVHSAIQAAAGVPKILPARTASRSRQKPRG